MTDAEFHSSPSDIDLFLAEPSLWVIKHFLGYRTEVGPAAYRGTSVEFGLAAHLVGDRFADDEEGKTYATAGLNTAKDYALYRYRQLTGGEITDAIEDEAKNIPLMLDEAIKAMKGRTGLLQRQRRIDMIIEGVPIQGYLDFVYADELIDLKSTKTVPNKPRAGHVRQMAIYGAATGLPARLLYCSAKKSLWHPVTPEMAATAMAQVRAACKAIKRVNEMSYRDAVELHPPKDITSFYWDPVSRYVAADLWS